MRRQWAKIIVLVISIAFIISSSAAWAMGIHVAPVLTGSMDPAIPAGSLVITKSIPSQSLTTGDVIAFQPPAGYSAPGGHSIMHRIASIEQTNNDRIATTKGDANPTKDPWKLSIGSEVGQKVVFSVPTVGRAVTALSGTDSKVRVMTLIGIGLLVVAVMLWPRRLTMDICRNAACSLHGKSQLH